MLKSISQWLTGLQAPQEQDREAQQHLAAAILLFEVARADQTLEQSERARIEQFLRDHWTLDQQALADLLATADRQAELNASLHEHVEIINRDFSTADKRRLLTGLWQIACADGQIHHHEEHLVRRIADLLYLSHSDFIQAKLAVTEGRA